MNLTELPIHDPDPERSKREVQQRIIIEGRHAYRLGFPITDCPPYAIEDWAIDWRNGWRWEKEEDEARSASRQNQND